MSKVAGQPGLRFHLFGDMASWTKTGLDTQKTALARGRLPNEEGLGREPIEQWGVLGIGTSSAATEGAGGAYLLFYEQFVQPKIASELVRVAHAKGTAHKVALKRLAALRTKQRSLKHAISKL